MFCSECGERMLDDSNFCPECGTSVTGGAMESTPPVSNPPKPKIKKKYLLAACAVAGILLFIAALFVFLGGDDKAVRQTVSGFSSELNSCLDFSVFADGGEMSFEPVWKYFQSPEAYAELYDWQNSLNSTLAFVKLLDESSRLLTAFTDKTGDYGIQQDGGLTGVLAAAAPKKDAEPSATANAIFEMLNGLTGEYIASDPLFNKEAWRGIPTSVSLLPTAVVIDKAAGIAALELSMVVKQDLSVFANSAIMDTVTVFNPGFTATAQTTVITVEALMQKQSGGKWLFTAFTAAE